MDLHFSNSEMVFLSMRSASFRLGGYSCYAQVSVGSGKRGSCDDDSGSVQIYYREYEWIRGYQ